MPEPKAVKNRMRLDIWVGDLDAELVSIEYPGATRLQDGATEAAASAGSNSPTRRATSS